jgi:CRP-like cAMP-binding protein
LFAECDDTHLQLLAFAGERVTFRPGETMMRAGEAGSAGFLIVSGSADVWVDVGQARKTVATVGPGALAGELAMIAGIAYPANITATSELQAVRIGHDVFMRVAGEFREFAARVHRGLAQRLELSLSELNRVRRLYEEALLPGQRKIERRDDGYVV